MNYATRLPDKFVTKGDGLDAARGFISAVLIGGAIWAVVLWFVFR